MVAPTGYAPMTSLCKSDGLLLPPWGLWRKVGGIEPLAIPGSTSFQN